MKLPLEFQLMHLIIRINESIIKIRRHKFTYKLVLRCLHNRTIKFERKLFKFSLKVLLILVILQYPLSTDTLPHSQRYRQQRITYKTERSLLNPGAALILMDRTYFDLKFKYDINTSFSNGDILRQTFVDYTHRMGLNTKGTIINFEIVKDGVSGLVKKIYSMDITRYTSIFYILKGFGTGDSNYCEMSEELSIIFNKTFIFWPCREKKSNNFLFPSYELIAKGINRIIDQFRWTDAIIVTSDKIVELALAIATNLNVPYYIAIGINSFHSIEILDEIGKVIIFTAAINDLETSKIFPRLQNYKNIRTVLIDVTGVAILNQPNQFLWGLNSSALIFKNKFELNNILVLTTITGKLKMFWQHTLEQSDQIITILENEVVFNDSTIYKRERQSCENVIKENELQDSWDLELESQEISKNNTYSQLIHGDLLLLFYFIAASLFPSLYNTQNMTPELNNFIVLEVFKKYEDQLNSNNLGLVNTNYKKHTTRIRWRPLLLLYNNQPYTEPSFSTHPIYPGYYDWCQKNGQLFEICGYLCWAIVSLFILLSIAVIGLAAVITISIRKYLLKKRLSRGPNKIVLSSSDFVFPIDARRVDEGIEAMLCCWLQQLQEFGGPEVDKPDLLKGSIGSLKNIGLANLTMTNKNICGSLAKNKAVLSMRARYNGDLVQLKEMSTNTSNELRSKAMDHLILAHGLRHENINPLIGWLCDPNRNAIVFEYCSRGSLQDVLIMDEIKLDWSFRLSLLTDLVRGMRYLHSSPIRFHGSLSSRNCVVDARWVLKITDYGLNVFYDSQGIPQPNKSSKELLWSAPEILRSSKGHFKLGSLQADVYSFGIIMQEVIVRGEPYCMLSLSPDDIIQKLMKPPPLIRPSVSKGAAPPEAINIMRQCWAEAPEMRPDFNLIFERFKQLNHGRKVNFVDTMFQMLEKYSNNLEELIKERTEQLDIERKKTEQLLNRMLPSSVAERLKLGLGVEPEEFSEVTIYFSDIVGFTTIAAHCSPVQVVDLLNDLYTCFDATINAYNVYKVETIGDAYMVVSGLPVIITDHAEQIASMALELLHQSGRFTIKHLPGVPLQLRIGLHTGPCCAGVVGLTMPRYCLFGDTVNTASRMESTGSSWRIHLSETTFNHLEKSGVYYLEPRGPIEIKGKGKMKTFWLLGKKGFEKSLPTPPPYGLSDALIKNSSRIIASTPTTSANQSSSQSSLLAVEVMNVKVEITPPIIDESNQILSSTPPDSNLHLNLSSCMNDIKMQITGPQQRKFSDLPSEVLLNPSSFRQFSLSPALGSTANSSLKLYKRIEDMMDLSSPYNHYKCLSPSESNLTQCSEGKYLYGLTVKVDGKPGSSKSLRRQFSLDKDNCSQQQSMGDIAVKKNEDPTTTTPSPTKTTFTLSRSHKPNSLSVAQDLDKIVEIPASPKCLLNNQKSSSPVTLSMIEPMSNSIYGTSSICTNKIINLQLNDEETNSTIFQQEKHYIV